MIDPGGSRIGLSVNPEISLQATFMSVNLDTNEIVTQFQLRATAELKRELDEVKWWEDRVRHGLVRRDHADRCIQCQNALFE